MRIMKEPVENAVGDGGIADLRIPGSNWQLAGEQSGTVLIVGIGNLVCLSISAGGS
jgi:hypothetical protein